jgi:hypothetical protein
VGNDIPVENTQACHPPCKCTKPPQHCIAGHTLPVEDTRAYKQFLEWYRNQFELGYPNGLGFDLVKAAFLAGHAKAVEDEY